MLLKEINQRDEAPNQDGGLKAKDQELTPVTLSPVKPLNISPRNDWNEPMNKEFNSSSDTCISDPQEDISLKRTVPKDKNSLLDLIHLNFDLNESKNSNTEEGVSPSGSLGSRDLIEESLQTSENKETRDKADHEKKDATQTNINVSKKNVAFKDSTPEVHQYENKDIQSREAPYGESHVAHGWVPIGEDISKNNDENEEQVPKPPVHLINTIASLLNTQSIPGGDDAVTNAINKLRSRELSNMSINERLNLFFAHPPNEENLDQHLQDLVETSKVQPSHGIDSITADIKKQSSEAPEELLPYSTKKDDLNGMTRDSSQSSMNSSVGYTVVLESSQIEPKADSGIHLNDGIGGFPDSTVEDMIKAEGNSESNSFSKEAAFDNKDEGEEEFYDSSDLASHLFLKPDQGKSTKETQMESPRTEESPHSTGNNVENDEQIAKNAADEDPSKTNESSDSQHVFLYRKDDLEPDLEDLEHLNQLQVEAVSDYGINKTDMRVVSNSSVENSNGSFVRLETDESLENRVTLRDMIDKHLTGASVRDGEADSINHSTVQKGKMQSSLDEGNPTFGKINKPLATSTNVGCDFQFKKYNPAKVEEAVDATSFPDNRELNLKDANLSKEKDEIALANSSNVLPPDEVLPPLTNIVSPMLDTTQHEHSSTGNFFEDSLSAEMLPENRELDYLSIWHSQEQRKKHSRKNLEDKLPQFNIEEIKTLPKHNDNRYRSLRPKKFKEINVAARRIVSPSNEDLHATSFLPELSDDSGFKDHFDFLDTTHNLSAISQSDFEVEGKHSSGDQRLREAFNLTKPSVLSPPVNSLMKPSKFRVPSLEIQKANSLASPCYQYDDIFEDTVRPSPSRAKTLKSITGFDREQIRRLLESRQSLRESDSSKVKLVRSKMMNKGAIQEPPSDFKERRRHASLCDIDIASSHPTITKEDGGISSTRTRSSFQFEDDLAFLANEINSNISRLGSVLFHKLLDTKEKNIPRVPIKDLKENESVHEKENISSAPSKENQGTPKVLSGVNMKNISRPLKLNVSPGHTLMPSDVGSRYRSALFSQNSVNQYLELISDEKTTCHHAGNHKQEVDFTPNKKGLDSSFKESLVIFSPGRSPLKGKQPKDTQSYNLTPDNENLLSRESPSKMQKMVPVIQLHSPKRRGVKRDKAPSPIQANDDLSARDAKENMQAKNNESMQKNGPTELMEHPSFSSSRYDDTTRNGTHDEERVNDDSLLKQHMLVDTSFTDKKVEKLSSRLNDERGKLFVRILGIKNINLSQVKEHKARLSLTLDNTVHSIKTLQYDMNPNYISIDKEFELAVGQSSEFIITSKVHYEPPKDGFTAVRERKVVKSKNPVGRLFGSKDVVTTTKYVPKKTEDLWANKIALDGSFGRCYVNLDDYEEKVTGKVCDFDLTFLNEWETVQANGGSVRRTPYPIAQIEARMLFIPKQCADETLPPSIKMATTLVEGLKGAQHFTFEGVLDQEGGDCELWKRRFFRLEGSQLIAFSEFSRKMRAKINLAKIVEVIYVDSTNLEKTKENCRNFSDIILVPHSFKLKFANGEIIDFGAPNETEKGKWVTLLESIIHRNTLSRQPWVRLMLNA